jgi:hypothetical protein
MPAKVAHGQSLADARKPAITADAVGPVNESPLSSGVCRGLTLVEILWITHVWLGAASVQSGRSKTSFPQ